MRLSKSSTLVFISACTLGILACSSDNSSSPSRAAISSSLSGGAGSEIQQTCPVAGGVNWPVIGNPSAQQQPPANGDPIEGGTLSVTCTVKPTGDGTGFQVEAVAAIGSTTSFHVFGNVTPSGNQTGLQAEWRHQDFGAYVSKGTCNTTYPAFLSTPDNPPVTAGRIWGTIDCGDVALDAGHACVGNATFRFENCTQQ